ncbi:unnamed protein product [Prunus armeniaca]
MALHQFRPNKISQNLHLFHNLWPYVISIWHFCLTHQLCCLTDLEGWIPIHSLHQQEAEEAKGESTLLPTMTEIDRGQTRGIIWRLVKNSWWKLGHRQTRGIIRGARKLQKFILFSGDGQTSSIEHIGRFTAQCEEADSDAQRLRLFIHSLTGAAFSWFINVPPNSVRDWSDMERIFHKHFYQTNREITVAELARMSQASDESPRDYLQRFKTCRNWCRMNLPEREFVKMAEEGLEFEYRKKFKGIEFQDMHDLINKVDRYASLLKEEVKKRTASKGTYYRNPVVSYAEADGPTEAESDKVEMSSVEVSIDKPFVCKGLVKADNNRTKIPNAKFATREMKAYTFDLTRAEAIFDLLLTEKKVKLSFGHKIPKPEELKGKTFCKYHSSWSHNTNNYVVLRDVIQKLIDEKKLQFRKRRPCRSTPSHSLHLSSIWSTLNSGPNIGKFVGLQKERSHWPNQSRYRAVGASRRAISTDYEEFGGQYNRRPTRRAVFDRLGAQSPSTSAGHKDEAAPRPVKTFKPPVVRDDRWYHAQLGGSTEPLTKTQLRGMQRQVQQARIQTVQVEGLKRQKKMATADEPPSVPIVPPTSSLQGRGALGRTVVPAE